MNDNRMKRWMDAIDDDLLEEAQRPLPRGGAARRWGALAACFCAAALALALWQPWSAGIGDNTAGADADFGAMDKSFSVAMPPVSDAELLSASLALPEGASLTSGYQWRQDGEGAVTFSGVAPDAQVIPMKVFDDSGTGAATATILAALEDAYRLGVDAVNLSLGSYGGFTVDEDALINDVYNKLDDAGIMVITAAGNETSSSYMNSYGTDAPLTGDPDNSVVAAPSVYPANLSIASVEGQEVYANYVLLGDEKITATDSQTSFLGLDSYVSLLKIYGDVSDDLAAPYDYVMVPGYGADSDYEGIDVTGKIAVVQRGGTDENGEPITFVTKIQNALWKNAIGILVYNNDTEHPDDCSIRMSTNYYQLPAAFISYNAAQKLAAKAGSGVGITPTTELTAEPNPSAGQMSTFTSIGATPDLRIKPELSAVGGNVYSSIPTVEGKGDYASMSGTSMASPYVAGASVLVKSYMAENWTGSYDAASMTENLMMSTASPVVDPETKLPYSPRLQGSGLIDLSAATSSDVVLYTDADQYGDTKPVLNLGDDVAKNGSYDLTFHARNMGKDAARYDVSVIAMSPATCTQDGSVTVTCDDCGAVLSTETMPATGHDYKDGKCTVCGAADPDYRPEQPEDPGQPEKPEQPENPGVRTGDSGVLLYMGLMMVALTGSAWVLRKKRAR